MPKKLTQDEFFEKVKRCNTYDIDVSGFIYVNNSTKGKVKCNVCGHKWETVPMVLFTNHGCPKCAAEYRNLKLTNSLDSVITKAKAIHGDKYNYDRVFEDYKNNKSKVLIGCPKHGYFRQSINSHLGGAGCVKCNGGVKYTKEDFVNSVDNENIDLSDFNYINSHTKGHCICKVCGYDWYAWPTYLRISNYGCPKCSIMKRADERRSSLSEFVEKFREKYPLKDYVFDDSVYVNALTKMAVKCKKHGMFEMTPNDLLSGHGCPICNESRLESILRGLLLENNIEHITQYRNKDIIGAKSLDFFIPNINVGIECQGEQHFKPIDHFGGEEELKVVAKRDRKKFDECKRNGITLFYFTEEKHRDFVADEYKDFTFYNEDELISKIKEMHN